MYQKIRNGFNQFLDFINTLTGAALLVIMCVVLLQVFCRFVIFKSLTWSEEVSRYLLVFVVLFGLATAVNENMLIKIDALDSVIRSARVRGVLDLLRTIVGLVCAVLITASSTRLFRVGMVQKSPAMQIPMIIMYAVVFISYLLATVALVFKTIDCVQEMKHPEDRNEFQEGGGDR